MLLLAAWPVTMANAAAPPPRCDAPEFRAFDFWLGSWEVHDGDGRLVGHNAIATEQQGCLVVERWQGAQSTGMSMNFYDPIAGQWRQLWVSPGVQIDIAGGMVAGSMVLEGTIVYIAERRTRPFRGSWTPLADGRVRQLFEEAGADDEWQTWFEGFYRPADAAASPG